MGRAPAHSPSPATGIPTSAGQTARQTKDPVEIGVAEQATRIDGCPHRPHVVEPRIPPSQFLGVQGVQLAPVRTATVTEQDLLDGQEVFGERLTVVAVNRDVGRRSSVGGRQPHVIGGRHPDLQRERYPPTLPCDQRFDVGDRLRERPAIDGVFHLAESHPPGGGEHHLRVIGELPHADQLRRGGIDGRDDRRHQPTGRAGQCEDTVRSDLVVEHSTPARQRVRHAVARHPAVRLHQRDIGVREPVELDMCQRCR